MIPYRIYLKGFLCYREEAEITFDGASLCMLAGPNGSGKSTVFDAVMYALFGYHRAGKQNAKELINKQADGFVVEFDFLLDGERYQARRTLKRNNRSSRQMRHWKPGAGEDGPGAWEEVPGTDTEKGFDAWVREHLGLTYETFTTSVLLLQGKADILLSAEPKRRFEVLAGIVDLQRYQRLHAKADEARRELKAEAEALEAKLSGIPEVSEAALAEAEERVRAAQQALHEAQEEVRRLQAYALALPLLQRLHGQREALKASEDQRLKAAAEERRAADRLAALEAEYSPLGEQYAAALRARSAADRDLTEKRTLLGEVLKRIERFNSVAGERTCSYCGQPLSAKHVKAEKDRLAAERAAAERNVLQAQQAYDDRAAEVQQLEDRRKEAEARLAAARGEVAVWRQQQAEAECDARHYIAACAQAYDQLAEPFKSQVSAALPADWLQTTYPTADDLAQMQQELSSQKSAEFRTLSDELRQAEVARAGLIERRESRQKLTKKYLKVSKQLHHYQLLAELLGPRRLQRELVRQAERGIVNYANAVLDRLSGGQLYLRLSGEEDGDGPAERALQLEAYHRSAGPDPINVAFLSGSQRFRVAVSLALGIGQYASRQHRPMESVIIDEGFGCLDRQGRQVMIQEMQNLRGQLRCILLVSHQEEFADAFTEGYRFEIQDGTTRVTRFTP
jgi:DNA repair exonuclease SbcCD ATPase subunit